MEPLFPVQQSGKTIRRAPIGASQAWRTAVDAAGWQCQGTVGKHRCEHRGEGVTPWRLHTVPTGDGVIVLCDPCAGKRQAADSKARKAQASAETPAAFTPETLF